MERILSVADVVAARNRIKPEIVRTPLVNPERLAKRVGGQVWLKLESFQRTGAFKFRGALNCVQKMVATQKKGELKLVTASSGNHGLGMSLAGKLSGAKVTVVMPTRAPQTKQNKARDYGAQVVLHGETYDDAQIHAKKLAAEAGAVYIPSFNHPDIMAGQGVIALEILEDVPELDVVVFPIGGGGLAAGMAVALRALVPGVKLYGVQAEGAASMKASFEAGKVVELPSISTVADGIAVKQPGDLTYGVIKDLLDDILAVSDDEIREAMRIMVTEAAAVPEPAGASGVAAVLSGKFPWPAGRRAAVVVTGGNVDQKLLEEVLRTK